jgi:YhcH/YjgK/YiaL family protein
MICAPFNELIIPAGLMSPNWEKALLWLKEKRWLDLPEGKTLIDGERFFVSRTKYKTKPYENCRLETHRRYADIQFVITGRELMEVCSRDGLSPTEPFNAEKDIGYLDGKSTYVHHITLAYPLAAVLFPADAHKPCIPIGEIAEVEKVLLKIEL